MFCAIIILHLVRFCCPDFRFDSSILRFKVYDQRKETVDYFLAQNENASETLCWFLVLFR